jgi:hypothetical protein
MLHQRLHIVHDIDSHTEALDWLKLLFHLNGYTAFIDSENRYCPRAAFCSLTTNRLSANICRYWRMKIAVQTPVCVAYSTAMLSCLTFVLCQRPSRSLLHSLSPLSPQTLIEHPSHTGIGTLSSFGVLSLIRIVFAGHGCSHISLSSHRGLLIDALSLTHSILRRIKG